MTHREWLQRIEALEQRQRDYYAGGREVEGDATGELICLLVSEGRAMGFCLPDGSQFAEVGEQPKQSRRKSELAR